jgi:hypothetical protein
MEKKRTKGAAKKPMRAVEDAFGLPPAVESLHGNDGPPKDPNAPSLSLSSDDEEVAPVDFTPNTNSR